MHPDTLTELAAIVADDRRADAAAQRASRAARSARRSRWRHRTAVRTTSVREAVGFGLIETGLRVVAADQPRHRA